MVLYLFLHFASAQTSSVTEPQDFTTLYLKYFILSRNGDWCLSWKEFTILLHFKTSQKDTDIGCLYITILQHSCPTLTEGLQRGEAAACIHAAHTRAEPYNPPAHSGSPEYFLLAWRRGRAQHTTMNNQNSWEVLCWATNLALKWELTNLLHQAKSMGLLPAQQSPLYGTQINGFPIVHLSLPSIMRSGWLSRHPIVLVQSLNGWIKKIK